jgi:hypothetical protein
MLSKMLPGLLAAVLLQAQSQPALDRATVLMRDYARGMTENVSDVRVKISDYGPDGKLRRVKNTSHRMSFTKGRFRGTAPDQQTDWESTIVVSHAGRGTLGLEMFTDRGIWDPVFAVSPGGRLRNEWTYESPTANILRYHSSAGCNTFEPDGAKFRFSRQFCGRGELAMDNGLQAKFEALGLPLTVGKEVLREYRSESTYRKIAMAGSSEPFLFPATATSTFVFKTHKIVVEAAYSLAHAR